MYSYMYGEIEKKNTAVTCIWKWRQLYSNYKVMNKHIKPNSHYYYASMLSDEFNNILRPCECKKLLR